MTPEDLHAIEALFHDALDLDVDARRARLDDRAATEPELVAEVRRLLADHEANPEFLEAPPELPAPERPPARIGEYELLEVLGEGGMGIVHLARQAHPDRLVALKLLRPGFVTDDAMRRLEHEAEILGRLDHPSIARIYEAGTALVHDRPQPYFAMERVIGAPITDATVLNERDRTARLVLFCNVCAAVAYAHRQGVVHRDLKPANVLVDEHGRPRVLDFGIARVTDPDAQLATLTGAGGIVGTIAYLAPELLTGAGPVGDPPGDVYALGVMLYEMLGGRRPHEIGHTPLPETIRRLAEVDAPLLGSVDRTLRGDLETIARTALARDPQLRYRDAGALEEDLRAFLAHRPIAARAPTARYVAGRFIARNRIAVAASSLILLVVIIAGAVVLGQARSAARTAQQMESLDAVVADVMHLQDDPIERHNPDLAVRLDRAVQDLDVIESDRPLGEATLRMAIGDAYLGLGRYVEAEQQYTLTAQLREAELGREAELTVDALAGVATARWRIPESPRVLELLREVASLRQAAFGSGHQKTLRAQNDLAMFLIADENPEDGEMMLRETLARQRESLREGHPDTLTTMHNLSRHLVRTERPEEAETLARESLALYRRFLGENEPRTLMATGNLARMVRERGLNEEAFELYEIYADGLERVLGPGHPDSTIARANQGSFLIEIGQSDEGIAAWQRARDNAVAARGLADTASLRLQIGLGRRLTTAKRYDEADRVLREAQKPAAEVGGSMPDRLARERARLKRKRGAG